MNNLNWSFDRFFRVVGSGRAYLNIVYLLLTFPLGIFYFVYLVTGISVGLSLTIIWVGIPILLLVIGGWWLLAAFERQMAIHWLGEEVGEMLQPIEEESIWGRLRAFLSSRVTWTSMVYLLVKFPLGIAAFVAVVTLTAITASFITAPLTYEWGFMQIDLWYGVRPWIIDSLNDSLILAMIGLLMWPITLHITNGIAWVNGWLAKHLLGMPGEESNTSDNGEEAVNETVTAAAT
ncbi:MAG: hypothetical protein DWQ07_13485 [Chloroflexi bacterium]|nr:MAG: hypothetical protein DWQ07_13485 [Chloroflexota bacterium]MBL1196751.1 hypothetical protein [Chloroflexota bacterium]NOH14045.1 sensor domain-containing protein [Chloroflexota bacterium]